MDALEGMMEASPDAVLVVDSEGLVRLVNRNVTDLLGYEPDTLEGRAVEDLLLEADREHHVRYREEYIASPEPRPMGSELDLYALHRDGSRVPVEISLGPIRRNGELYVLATISDVTKRKRRERTLQRQNERLEQFASIVSHDLRNPLHTFSGSLALAEETGEPEHYERCREAVQRMEALIDDLLEMAREGRPVTDLEPVHLAEVADRAWATVSTGGATLTNDLDLVVSADEGRLQQLFENLFRNAVDHGGDDVSVRLAPTEESPGFLVADDGPGIPDEERAAVFDRGYTTAPDGTGVGLAIVADVADAHGWRFDVTESDAGGARFEFLGIDFETS